MVDAARPHETRVVGSHAVVLCGATCARALDRGVPPVLPIDGGRPGARGRRRTKDVSWRSSLQSTPPGADQRVGEPAPASASASASAEIEDAGVVHAPVPRAELEVARVRFRPALVPPTLPPKQILVHDEPVGQRDEPVGQRDPSVGEVEASDTMPEDPRTWWDAPDDEPIATLILKAAPVLVDEPAPMAEPTVAVAPEPVPKPGLVEEPILATAAPTADLATADLATADLATADLATADLATAAVPTADLVTADLATADLATADLATADVPIADLATADVPTADLATAAVPTADLATADLVTAELETAWAQRVEFQGGEDDADRPAAPPEPREAATDERDVVVPVVVRASPTPRPAITVTAEPSIAEPSIDDLVERTGPSPAAERVSTSRVAARPDRDPEPGAEELDQAPAPSRRPAWAKIAVGLLGAAAIGGAAFALIRMSATVASNPAVAPPPSGLTAGKPVPPTTATSAAPLAASTTPEAGRERALAVLRELMASTSIRIAREAAQGLARTCDRPALDQLARALSSEPSAIAKVGVARTIAACGDARGKRHLLEAMRGGRRDVKAEAARMLVEIGDDAGVDALVALSVPRMFRVSAGELLARHRHPRGLPLLKAALADSKLTADERLRAVIALVAAGDTARQPEVRAALDRLDFRQVAAQALARHGDEAARPHLVAGLELPSLRVGAAQGLRRLDAKLAAAPLLPPLVAALAREPEVARITAAEAILVLTGPVVDVERP